VLAMTGIAFGQEQAAIDFIIIKKTDKIACLPLAQADADKEKGKGEG